MTKDRQHGQGKALPTGTPVPLGVTIWTSLAVQWLILNSTAGGVDSIPGRKLRSHMPGGVAKKKKKKSR